MSVTATNLPRRFATLMRILRRIRDCMRFQRDHRRTLASLDALSDRELADFGMSRHELQLAARKAVCA